MLARDEVLDLAKASGIRPWHWRLERLYESLVFTGKGRIIYTAPNLPESIIHIAPYDEAHRTWADLTRINPVFNR